MYRTIAAMFVVVLSSCSQDLPESWSWNEACDGNDCTTFTTEDKELLREAFDKICETVHYCPVETRDGEMHVIAENAEQYARNGRGRLSAAFNDGKDPLEPYGSQVHVNVDVMARISPQWRVRSLMHEIMHVGLVDHEDEGLMAELFDTRIELPNACVDQHTVNKWCEEVGGCDGTEKSNCE